MDQPDPEPTPTPAREQRIAQRLQTFIDEPIVAWTQGWVSRDIRMHTLFAARTLDFAVLTDGSLCLVSTGFFSRRPHRRVFWTRLHEMTVADDAAGRGRRLRIVTPTARPILLELRNNEKTTAFASELAARTHPEESP